MAFTLVQNSWIADQYRLDPEATAREVHGRFVTEFASISERPYSSFTTHVGRNNEIRLARGKGLWAPRRKSTTESEAREEDVAFSNEGGEGWVHGHF